MPRNVNRINLSSFDNFCKHPWVKELENKYETHDQILADEAVLQCSEDLELINEKYRQKYSRVAFISIDGRAKETDSLLRKLYEKCKGKDGGITKSILTRRYNSITDKAGVRFACAYFDEIEEFINDLVRPQLLDMGYNVRVSKRSTGDKNKLDDGDDNGYRAYHFYVEVPTLIDLFGNTKLVLCEVQARTEFQHIWAVRSHELLYKPEEGLRIDNLTRDDMRALSTSLRAADQALVSIRKRARATRE